MAWEDGGFYASTVAVQLWLNSPSPILAIEYYSLTLG